MMKESRPVNRQKTAIENLQNLFFDRNFAIFGLSVTQCGKKALRVQLKTINELTSVDCDFDGRNLGSRIRQFGVRRNVPRNGTLCYFKAINIPIDTSEVFV